MRLKVCIAFALGLLLWAVAPAAMGADDCGPEPRLERGMHKALHKAYKKLDKKQYAAAAKILDEYAKENPEAAHYRFSFMRGILAYTRKDMKQAGKHFSQTVKLRPCFGPAMRNLAAVQYELGRPLEAAETALKAYKLLKPRQPAIKYEAAVFFLMGKKPERALPILVELSREPKPKESWLTALARCYMEIKQPKKARPVVERLLEMKPGSEQYWRLLASIDLMTKSYTQAAADLEVAYRLKPPKSPSAWRTLAGVYRMAGVPLKAIDCYKHAFGPEPKAKDHDLLARVYLRGSYFEPALAEAEKAIAKKPTPKRLAFAARLNLRLKQYAKAYALFSRASKLGDKQGRYSLMAGYAAMQMERWEKARRALGRSLKLAKKNSSVAKEAAKALESVKAFIDQQRALAGEVG